MLDPLHKTICLPKKVLTLETIRLSFSNIMLTRNANTFVNFQFLLCSLLVMQYYIDSYTHLTNNIYILNVFALDEALIFMYFISMENFERSHVIWVTCEGGATSKSANEFPGLHVCLTSRARIIMMLSAGVRLLAVPRHPISTIRASRTLKKKKKRSYMGAHELMTLLNELRKKIRCEALSGILSVFPIRSNKFSNTGARMQDSIYHMTLKSYT